MSVLGSELLGGELCGRLLVDECSWTLTPVGGEGGPPPVLQLDLMKRAGPGEASDESAKLWGYILASERDACVGRYPDEMLGSGGEPDTPSPSR